MARLHALFFALMFALLPFAANAADGGVVKGKVNYQGKPLEGAVIYLYSKTAGGFAGAADFKAGPTKQDGAFEVALPKGKFYLIAKKTSADGPLKAGDFYSYYGGNPVMVGDGETINIGINCSSIMDTGGRYKEGGTGIRGKVFADGKPLDRARVTLYQDGDTIFRGIGYASVLTNKDGEFAFNLDAGTYFVIARKRIGEDRMGPLGEGDSFGFAHDNPVEVKKGSFTMISINAVSKLVKVKEGGQEATLGGTVKSGETVVEGVIRDKDGKPAAGVYASAFRDSMMTQKPDFISKKTGADGVYSINLSEGGEYFIGARNTIGGPAEKGDLLGRYAGNEDHSIKIKTGEKAKGIDITVETVE
jgi:hypothetical protein